MITGFAHAAVCVPDVEAAAQWYQEVLGLSILSAPYLMEGPSIEHDMGELVPSPVAVKAAILGTSPDDHVVELIEYPRAGIVPTASQPSVTHFGITHIGLVCDDIVGTRSDLEEKGVTFLVEGIAEVAGLRTTWFTDPWGTIFILLEKQKPKRPYWRQYADS